MICIIHEILFIHVVERKQDNGKQFFGLDMLNIQFRFHLDERIYLSFIV